MDEISAVGLIDKIRMIAPSHGRIWVDPAKIIHAYADCATGKATSNATIVYDTLHYSPKRWLTRLRGAHRGRDWRRDVLLYARTNGMGL
jgi:flavorubredoxin